MSEPVWLTPEIVIAIHEMQLAEHGGPAGIRDMGMLESALGRPQNKFAYGETDLAVLAAAYGFGVITLAFAIIGFAGYAGWGSALLAKDGGNITSQISKGGSLTLSTICQVSIIVVSLSHFLVMFNPVGLLMDSLVGLAPIEHKVAKVSLKMLGRSCVVGLMLLLALFVPSFGTIVDLVGSTVVLPLQVIFPILFFCLLCKDELLSMSALKRGLFQALFAVAVAVALVAMGYGLYNVIMNW